MKHQKIERAFNFLKKCQKVAEKTKLTSDVVYGLLMDLDIKDEDIVSNEKIEPLAYYDKWGNGIERSSYNFIHAFYNYWVSFNNKITWIYKPYVKIYISLDREHLCEGVIQLFNYINNEGIPHESKATSHVRTDNVIIRLSANEYNQDDSSFKKIIKYLESNNYLKNGMNNLNPFIPTVGKIGVMYDNGESYNRSLANLISDFIRFLDGRAFEFLDFVKFVKDTKKDDSLFLTTFNQAFFEKSDYQRKIEDIQSQIKFDSKSNLYIDKYKRNLLRLAIITAFEKYNKKQAISAITNALKGDYSYFSRVIYDEQGNKIEIRKKLEENLQPDEVKEYILEDCDTKDMNSLEDVIRNYIDSVIYEYKGYIFEDALFATVHKYNDRTQYIASRIKRYAEQGVKTVFSSYNIDIKENFNFRQSVVKNIPPEKVYDIVASILYNNGIKYSLDSNLLNIDLCANLIKEKVNNKIR